MKIPLNFDWPGTIWIISDLHFGHNNIINFERHEFKTINEHDKTIFDNLKKFIKPSDTFLCLGDIGRNWVDYIKKLKCYKVLILGNHDNESKNEYKKYWNEVYDSPLFLNKFLVCSHEPTQVSDHFINIHGHLHNAILNEEKYFSVSAASLEKKYYPIKLNKIYKKITNLPRIRKEKFLEEWYKDKYKFISKDKFKKDFPIYSNGNIVENAKDITSFFFQYKIKLKKDIEMDMINWDEMMKDFSYEKLKKEIKKWKK